MRYVAAALLAALGGEDISAANIEKILSSVGVEADAASLKVVVDQLAGKSVEEVLAEGRTKLASMPSGGGAAAPAAAAGGAAAAAAPVEEKKEEKKEESEEEDDDMGFGLFD
jgi:large subunit ribosomal protein LP2